MLPFLEKKTGSASQAVESVKREPDEKQESSSALEKAKSDLLVAKGLIDSALKLLEEQNG